MRIEAPVSVVLLSLLVPIAISGCGTSIECGEGLLKVDGRCVLADGGSIDAAMDAAIDAAMDAAFDTDGVDATGDTGDGVDAGGDVGADGCVPTEEMCNGADDDCDGIADEGVLGTFFADADGDGRGTVDRLPCTACEASDCEDDVAWVTFDDDCDDECAVCFPGGTEVCDDLDNDCDGSSDEGVSIMYFPDVDGDGFGDDALAVDACSPPSGSHVEIGGDCAPDDADAFPGQTMYFTDPVDVVGGFDYDCNGTDEYSLLRVNSSADCNLECTPLAWSGSRPECGVEGTVIVCFRLMGSCSGTFTTRSEIAECR